MGSTPLSSSSNDALSSAVRQPGHTISLPTSAPAIVLSGSGSLGHIELGKLDASFHVRPVDNPGPLIVKHCQHACQPQSMFRNFFAEALYVIRKKLKSSHDIAVADRGREALVS